MGKTDPWPQETRARALEIAAERGDKAASEATGVPRTTLRSWRFQARNSAVHVRVEGAGGGRLHTPGPPQTPPGTPQNAPDDLQRARKTLKQAQRAADLAVARLREVLPQQKGSQALAISFGILTDKIQLLERSIAAAEVESTAIEHQRTEILLSIIEMFWEAVGAPLGDSARALLARMLREAEGGSPVVSDPQLAEAARRELYDHVGERIRDRLVSEVHERVAPVMAEHRGLPEPDETAEAEEAELAPPVKVWSHAEPAGSQDPARVRYASEVAEERGGGVVRPRNRWKNRYGDSEFS